MPTQSALSSALMQVLVPMKTWPYSSEPYNHQVMRFLKSQITSQTHWTRVGDNAEMVAWPNLKLRRCPYPMNIALERFYAGKTVKYSALLHFRLEPVTQNSPAWLKNYNSQ